MGLPKKQALVPSPRHAASLVLASVLVGLLWYGFVIWVIPLTYHQWADLRHAPQLSIALSFAIAIPMVTWPFRRQIAATRLAWSLPIALIGLVLGALCFRAVHFTTLYIRGDFVEEVRMTPSLPGKLLWSVICIVYTAALGIAEAAKNYHLFVPFAWVSFLFIRWAGGGLTVKVDHDPRGDSTSPRVPE